MEKKQDKEATDRYSRIMARIFEEKYKEGALRLEFERRDIERVAADLKIRLPKNLGDVIYSFRHRKSLPQSILAKAPKGQEWLIRSAGRAKYAFEAVSHIAFSPNPNLAAIKVPDATPGIISKYAMSDEQAVLAMVRYNRLIDIFTGITCYSLQSHLRTTVSSLGQIETDEVYVGVDKRGVQYVFPVQAKGPSDRLGVVQIEQDLSMCAEKFPALVCRPVAAQRMADGTLALFELIHQDGEVKISAERHYRLVPPDQVSESDLSAYQRGA